MARSTKENPSPSETDGTSRRHNRRQALALGGAAAAAAAVAALGMNGGKKAHAATGDFMKVGYPNESNPDDWTGLVGSKTDGPVLHLRNDAEPLQEKWEAVGLDAMSREGTAVVGTTFGSEGFGTRGLSYIGSPDIPSEQWVPGPGIGVDGISGSGPGVRGTSGSGPGVHGTSDSGRGVEGHSQSGFGVHGHSVTGSGVEGMSDPGPGVEGNSQTGLGTSGNSVSGIGVGGGSDTGAGVLGHSQSGPGVEGHSQSNRGVQGWSDSGPGVAGHSQTAEGVVGSAPGDHPGVVAFSGDLSTSAGPPDGGVALAVLGKAVFSTAGADVVAAKADAASVANPAVTDDSHITVTFIGDPGRARVAWVERDPGVGFTVHLSGRARSPLPFTYLIVEPGA